jgi:hypothetical protein
MTDTPEFHLCPEGERLYDEWNKLGKIDDDNKAANGAWTAYQDHRAACNECTKVRT